MRKSIAREWVNKLINEIMGSLSDKLPDDINELRRGILKGGDNDKSL